MKGMVKIYFGLNSGEILSKLQSKGFPASSLSSFDFSTLFIKSHHNLIKEILTEVIEHTFNRDGLLFLACNEKRAFITSGQSKDIFSGNIK